MTDWFRSWHGAPTDPKWLGIARRAGVVPGIAVAVAWALMDRASQSDDRGSIDGYDAEGLAYFYGCEPENVEAIVDAMADKGMIIDGRFSSWEKRQPRREDDSSQRVREHRERKKRDAERTVTQRNAPDTDTDTEDTSSLRSDVCPEQEKSAPASQPVIELPATQGQSVAITAVDVAEWADAFPAVDVQQQLRAIRQWLLANPQKRKTSRGMKRFVVSWLSREQDKGGSRTTGPPPRRESEFARQQRECTEALERKVYGDRYEQSSRADFDLEPGNWRAH